MRPVQTEHSKLPGVVGGTAEQVLCSVEYDAEGYAAAVGRLRAAKVVHERLGALVRKLERLEATAAEMGGSPSSNDGEGVPCPGPASSPT